MKECQLYAVAQSAAADATSSAYDLGDLQIFSIAVDFSGSTLAGTLTLECSNNNSDWVTVTNSSQAVTTAASHVWNVTAAGYRYVRVFWDFTSGTGTIAAKLVAKQTLILGV